MSNDGKTVGETTVGATQRPGGDPTADGKLSTDAVLALYEEFGTELLAFLVGVLRNVSDASDVFQIIFRRVVEVGHTAHEETIKGWLFKLALREALAYRRQGVRLAQNLEKYSRDRETVTQLPSFEQKLIVDEDVARLKLLLAQLPLDQQHVVRLRIYEEKTFALIADELNVPLGTVLTRMRLALEKLRKLLAED